MLGMRWVTGWWREWRADTAGYTYHRMRPDAYGKNVIATTMWSDLADTAVGLKRMTEGMQGDSFWDPMIKKGAYVLRNDNSPSSAREIVEKLVNKSKVTLQM